MTVWFYAYVFVACALIGSLAIHFCDYILRSRKDAELEDALSNEMRLRDRCYDLEFEKDNLRIENHNLKYKTPPRIDNGVLALLLAQQKKLREENEKLKEENKTLKINYSSQLYLTSQQLNRIKKLRGEPVGVPMKVFKNEEHYNSCCFDWERILKEKKIKLPEDPPEEVVYEGMNHNDLRIPYAIKLWWNKQEYEKEKE